jgi:ABC-type branched-subunit amino acid transport system substrate-binding protein
MRYRPTRREFGTTALAAIAASTFPAPYLAAAEKKYDPGASDTEIKLGQTVPHSGPGSLYGVLGRVGEAYFQMINDKGGLNGRKITFLTLDDAYSAPKCVEATRRLVEQEEVLALYGSLGTAPQTAVHKYLNSKGVPQLLLNTGASKWNDPKNYKWTMAGLPLYPTEARILAKHVIGVKPDAKIGILYQNDDFGRDFLGPFKKTLADAGGKAQVIMEQTYDLTDPTIDSQIVNLSKSGADTFYNITTGKFTSQSVRKVAEVGWKPLQLLSAGSTGRSILSAAGFENAKDIVAIRYAKDAGVPRWANDPEAMGFEALRKQYLPLRRRADPRERAEAGGQPQRLPLAILPRRRHLQLYARRLHPDEDALHLDLQRPGLGHLGQAGDGVTSPSPRSSRGKGWGEGLLPRKW